MIKIEFELQNLSSGSTEKTGALKRLVLKVRNKNNDFKSIVSVKRIKMLFLNGKNGHLSNACNFIFLPFV
jgi:hypothetical protein